MGIFDFVRNAGAKVGIGKSTDEIAAEEAKAEAAAQAKEMAAKRNKTRQKMRAAAAERRSAAAAEKRAELKQSVKLEQYVRKLGFDIKMLDIRFDDGTAYIDGCLLYTSPSPRDRQKSRMPSSA